MIQKNILLTVALSLVISALTVHSAQAQRKRRAAFLVLKKAPTKHLIDLTKLLLTIAGLFFSVPSVKSEIMFYETMNLKEAITTSQILAANTKEDAELMAALMGRRADFKEFNEFAAQRNIIVLCTGTHIMIDRIEVTPGSYHYAASVLVHERGSSQALWIDVFFLLHGCIKSD